MKIIINPDTEYANDVKRRIKANGGYCPCQLVKSEDTKCKCKLFLEQIERNEAGACHCGLWIAVKEA